jgi:hypothetical protein
VNHAGIAIGVVAVLVGLTLGSLMLASPEGINPAYPVWIALLAPLAFVFGGFLICAHALGQSVFVAITFRAVAFCLLVIVNWGAFFSDHIHCREALSFLGVAILARYPSEVDCKSSLRIIMGCIDALVLVLLTVLVWEKWQAVSASQRNEAYCVASNQEGGPM